MTAAHVIEDIDTTRDVPIIHQGGSEDVLAGRIDAEGKFGTYLHERENAVEPIDSQAGTRLLSKWRSIGMEGAWYLPPQLGTTKLLPVVKAP